MKMRIQSIPGVLNFICLFFEIYPFSMFICLRTIKTVRSMSGCSAKL